MNNTNFKISSPFLSCFNNLSGLYFEALVSRFWRGLVGSKFLLFHGSEEESVYCQIITFEKKKKVDYPSPVCA